MLSSITHPQTVLVRVVHVPGAGRRCVMKREEALRLLHILQSDDFSAAEKHQAYVRLYELITILVPE